MSFHQVDDQTLLAYADGALDKARQAEIAIWLEDAPDLQNKLDTLLDLQRGLRSTFDAADFLPAPGPAIWERIKERTSGRRWQRLGVAIGAAAGALLLVALVLRLRYERQAITAIRPTPAIEPAPISSIVPIGTLPIGRITFAIMRDPIADGACGRLGVYVLNAGVSEPTYIADGCNPVLSPDRTHIAYTRAGHIFVRDAGGADSGSEINVTGADLFGVNPVWSFDSRKIVFSGDRADRAEIYTVDIDGNHLSQITHSTTDLAAGRPGIDPIWSSDGKRIAFTVPPALPQTDANWDVYVINADGTHMTRLTEDPARDELIGWTPDGRQILFTSERSGRLATYIMNADGTQQRTFFQLCAYPVWSPDRSQIACGHDGQLFIMNGDGSQRNLLTKEPGNNFNPIWTPDGQYIVFSSFSTDWQFGAIYVVRADGTRLARLVAADKWLQWAQR